MIPLRNCSAARCYTNSLYIPDLELPRFNKNSKKNILDNKYPYYLWHYKLCYINKKRIPKLHKKRKYLFLLIMNHIKLVKLVYWIKLPKHHLLEE
jgi:hypothetical protein